MNQIYVTQSRGVRPDKEVGMFWLYDCGIYVNCHNKFVHLNPSKLNRNIKLEREEKKEKRECYIGVEINGPVGCWSGDIEGLSGM